jgi:hypothetical protein
VRVIALFAVLQILLPPLAVIAIIVLARLTGPAASGRPTRICDCHSPAGVCAERGWPPERRASGREKLIERQPSTR